MARVLIVEDDRGIRKLLLRFMTSEYECVIAQDAAEARQCLAHNTFDIMLCDIRMPGESGIELSRYVMSTYNDTAVVIVSGVNEQEIVDAALEIGVFGYLVKPIEELQLRITVRNALKRLELDKLHRNYEKNLEATVQNRTRQLQRTITDLKQTQQELERSKAAVQTQLQFLQTLIDAIPSPVFSKDSDGRFTVCNKAFEEYTGLKRDQIVGRTVHAIAPEDLAAIYHQKDMDLLSTGGSQIYDSSVQYADGSRHEVVFKKATYTDNDGKVAGLIGIINDRTELIDIEHKLRDSETQLKAILENIQSGVLVIRAADRKIVTANRRALEMTGYAKEELIDSICHHLICTRQPKDCPVFDHGATLTNTEALLKTKTGTQTVLKTVIRLNIHGEEHLISSFSDISKLKQTEVQLTREKEKYERIFNNIQDVYFEIGVDGMIYEISPSVEAIGGYRRDELLGTRIHNLYADVGERDRLIAALLEQKRLHDYEIRLKDKAGQIRTCALHVILTFDPEGNPDKLVGSMRDITDRKQAEERQNQLTAELQETVNELKRTQSQMVHSEKMASIGQLAAGVAHEINNPTGYVHSNLKTLQDYQQDILRLLNAYDELVELIRSQPEDVDRRQLTEKVEQIHELAAEIDTEYLLQDFKELVADCLEGTERIKKIVMDLKDFAHPGEDQVRTADINANIESTLNVVWNELKYKAEVTKQFGKLPPVECYPQQLNQVFVNLLVNAAQAIEEKGQIRIETAHCNGAVQLTFSDNGCGIPADKLSKIFDPFYTTKDVGKGTGLGLNVVHNIIEKHHGRITVDSKVGQGTTFCVQLPVHQKEALGELPDPNTCN